MILSPILALYAAAVALMLAPALRRAQWVERAPGYGLWAWMALSWSLVISTVLAVASLCLGMLASPAPLHASLAMCLQALTGQAGLPCAVLASLSLLGLVGGASRLLLVLTRKTWHAHQMRRQQATALHLLGRTDHELGIVLLNDHRAAAYCLPGRARRIVLTTAAYERLTPAQLQAVLAHEHAHLDGQHALLRTLGALPSRLLPGLPAARHANEAIHRLLEYRADDAACRRTQRLTLAEALLALGTPGAAPVLNAAGTATAERITRLLATPGETEPRLAMIVAAATGVLSGPVLLTAATAALAGPGSACPLVGMLPC